MDLTKLILENINQVDIFAHYLKIESSEIEKCINNSNKKIKNPLRNDRHASLSFKYYSYGKHKKLKMKDWSVKEYEGDCFDIAGLVLHKNIHIPLEFVEICNDIIKILLFNKECSVTAYTDIPKHNIGNIMQFEVYVQQWTIYFYRYWFYYIHDKKYHTSFLDFLQTQVYVISKIYLSETGQLYYDNYKNELAYCYKLDIIDGIQTYQFYFPNRSKSQGRFKTNSKIKIWNFKTLDTASTLVLIKSNKDNILLTYLLSLTGLISEIHVRTISSESIRLDEKQINLLHTNYKRIIMMVDFDAEGIYNGFYHKQFGIEVIYIPCNNRIELILIDLKRFVDKINAQFNTTYTSMSVLNFYKKYRYKPKYEKVKDLADFLKANSIELTLKIIKKYIDVWKLI